MAQRRISSVIPEHFTTAHGEHVTLAMVIQQLHDYVVTAPERQYRLIIGTDSLAGRKQRVEFITALVIHRVGAGGRYFWQSAIQAPIVTLRERMYHEALLSIHLAQRLVGEKTLQTLLSLGELEIHVDIGRQGPTREMIQEIVGMVKAHGFAVRIKPDAFAASKVADRHTVALVD